MTTQTDIAAEETQAAPEEALTTKVLRLALAAAVVGIGVFGAVGASGFSEVARRFPLYISLGIVIIGTIVLIREVMIMVRGGAFSAAAYDYQVADLAPSTVLRRGLLWFGIVLGFIGVMALVGYLVAALVFLTVTLIIGAKMRWWTSLIAGVIGTGAVYALAEVLVIPLPEGIFYIGL